MDSTATSTLQPFDFLPEDVFSDDAKPKLLEEMQRYYPQLTDAGIEIDGIRKVDDFFPGFVLAKIMAPVAGGEKKLHWVLAQKTMPGIVYVIDPRGDAIDCVSRIAPLTLKDGKSAENFLRLRFSFLHDSKGKFELIQVTSSSVKKSQDGDWYDIHAKTSYAHSNEKKKTEQEVSIHLRSVRPGYRYGIFRIHPTEAPPRVSIDRELIKPNAIARVEPPHFVGKCERVWRQEGAVADQQFEETCKKILSGFRIDAAQHPFVCVRSWPLSFYEHADLFEVAIQRDQASARTSVGYCVGFQSGQGGTQWDFRGLNGTSEPIRKMNASAPEASRLKLKGRMTEQDSEKDEDTIASYIRFFCWAVEGDKGPFFVPEQLVRLNLAGHVSADASEAINGTKLLPQMRVLDEGELEKPGKEPQADPDVGFYREAVVIYEGYAFRARFRVDQTGVVAMLDDNPLELGGKQSTAEARNDDYADAVSQGNFVRVPVDVESPREAGRLDWQGAATEGNTRQAGIGQSEAEPNRQDTVGQPDSGEDNTGSDRTFSATSVPANGKPCSVDAGPTLEEDWLVFKDYCYSQTTLGTALGDLEIKGKRGVRFVNCEFVDAGLAFNGRILPSLIFESCVFKDGRGGGAALDFSPAKVTGDLKFHGCGTDGELKIHWTEVDGELSVFRHNKSERDETRSPAGFDISLTNIVVKRDVKVDDVIAEQLEVERATIDGNLLVRALQFCYLKIVDTHVKGNCNIYDLMATERHGMAASESHGIEITGLHARNLWVQETRMKTEANQWSFTLNAIDIDQNVTLRDLDLNGPIGLTTSKIKGTLWLLKIRNAASMRLYGVAIDYDVVFEEVKVGMGLEGQSLLLYGAQIGGSVSFAAVSVQGDVEIIFSRIGRMFWATSRDAQILYEYWLKCGGDLIFNASDIGGVVVSGISLEGDLQCRYSKLGALELVPSLIKLATGEIRLAAPQMRRMDVRYVEIGGEMALYAINAFPPAGVRLFESLLAWVDIDKKSQPPGVVVQNCVIGGLVSTLPENQSIVDKIRADHKLLVDQAGGSTRHDSDGKSDRSKIMKYLELLDDQEDELRSDKSGGESRKQEFNDSEGKIHLLPPREIKGDLDLRANEFKASVKLYGLKIWGRLNVSDSEISTDLKVKQSRRVRYSRERGLKTVCSEADLEKLVCHGDVDLSGLEVSRTFLESTEGDFVESGSDSAGELNLRDAKISGDLIFIRRPREDKTEEKDLTKIDKELNLSALVANKVVICGNTWGEKNDGTSKHGDATLSLERARIGCLVIVEPIPPKIDLTSIKVERWGIGNYADFARNPHGLPNTSAEKYMAVMRESEPFDCGVWVAVEADLRDKGEESGADKIYYETRERLETPKRYTDDDRKPGLLKRLIGWVEKPIGRVKEPMVRGARKIARSILCYGTCPLRPLLVLLLCFLPLWWMLSDDSYVAPTADWIQATTANCAASLESGAHRLSSDEQQIFASLKQGADCEKLTPKMLGHDWGAWDGLSLALRYGVPIVDLFGHDHWQATNRPFVRKEPVSEKEGGGFSIHPLPVSPELLASIVALYAWIAWPISLIFAGSKVVRGRRK